VGRAEARPNRSRPEVSNQSGQHHQALGRIDIHFDRYRGPETHCVILRAATRREPVRVAEYVPRYGLIPVREFMDPSSAFMTALDGIAWRPRSDGASTAGKATVTWCDDSR
jgi:hypothetical protein